MQSHGRSDASAEDQRLGEARRKQAWFGYLGADGSARTGAGLGTVGILSVLWSCITHRYSRDNFQQSVQKEDIFNLTGTLVIGAHYHVFPDRGRKGSTSRLLAE